MDLAITIFTAIANLGLGFIVLIKNPKSTTNRLLAILTLLIASWTIANFFSLNSNTQESTLFWIRAVMFITSPFSLVLLLFLSAFPKNKLEFNKYILIFLLSVSAFISIIAFTPYVFSSVSIKDGIHPVPGFGIIPYSVLTLGCLVASFFVMIKKYKNSSGLTRLQLKYLIVGAVLTFTSMAITNLIFVIVLNFSNFVVFGPLFSLILIGFISYAIVKHKLMDIRLIIARTVAYVLLLLTLGSVYAGLIFGVSTFLLPSERSSVNVFIYSALALFVAITAQPLKELIDKATSKVFFKNDYDSSALLSRLTKILATKINLEEVSQLTLKELLNTTGISYGSYFIFHNNKDTQFFFEGLAYEKINELNNKYNPEIKTWFSKLRDLIFFEEVEDEKVKQLMRELELEAIIPLLVGEKFHGLLLLGGKKTGEIYSYKDVNLLKIFGPEVSVAIENSKAYEEIRRFNITLKEEVDRQTKDLQVANKKLKELDQLKDEFVSLASHELRTPMTIIKSYLWMVMNKKSNLPPEKEKSYLERAYESTQRLINLVNDMLNVSRIESGRLKLELQEVDFVELSDKIVRELATRAKQLNLGLSLLKPKVNPPKLTVDPEKIEQLLVNLVGNAFKFTPPGGAIRIEIVPREKDLLVHVIDNGKGMDKVQMSALFQKFATIGGNYLTKENIQGTGLGLYISKSLVELHGGKIWADSGGVGKGSTFSFTLPYASPKSS